MSLAGAHTVIEADRLRLHPIALAHAEGLLEAYRDPEVMLYWSDRPTDDLDEVRRRVQADMDMAAVEDDISARLQEEAAARRRRTAEKMVPAAQQQAFVAKKKNQ